MTFAISQESTPRGDVPDYEVILVTYRSAALVRTLLSTLPNTLPVAIVDNAHGVDGLSTLPSERPATRYVDGPGAGFARGANIGVQGSTHEVVVFVNPDSAPSIEQLDTLATQVAADPSLGAVSATTVWPDGQVEIGTGGWEPSVRRAVVHAIGAHKLFPTAGLWARPVPHEPIELDWVSGACMAVRRQTFLDLGGFDEQFFVYNEDVAFGRQIREAGLRLVVRTDQLVGHLDGASGDGKSTMLQFRSDSLIRYVSQHNGPLSTVGIRLALTLGYLPRIVVSVLRGRRSQVVEHAAYVKGLWLGPPPRP